MDMKIHSLKLTFQDVETKDKKTVAVVFGTVYLDDGKVKMDINGPVLDEHNETTPEFETINFTTALANIEGGKKLIQQLVMEALTLKNLKIAERNGELSHFIEAVGGSALAKPTKGFRKTMSDTKYLKKKPSKTIVAPRKKAK